jgi:hypothetical protein
VAAKPGGAASRQGNGFSGEARRTAPHRTARIERSRRGRAWNLPIRSTDGQRHVTGRSPDEASSAGGLASRILTLAPLVYPVAFGSCAPSPPVQSRAQSPACDPIPPALMLQRPALCSLLGCVLARSPEPSSERGVALGHTKARDTHSCRRLRRCFSSARYYADDWRSAVGESVKRRVGRLCRRERGGVSASRTI